MRKAIFLGILGILLISVMGLANATPVNEQLSLQELTEDATIILIGNVENIKSEWNEDETQIFTNITISVGEVIKGDVPDENITIRHMGGTVDNIILYIVDSPQFSLDEEVLLFVKPGPFPIVGMSQGKFTIETDSGTGEKMVKELGISLDDFIDLINNSVQVGTTESQKLLKSAIYTSDIGILQAASDDFRVFGPFDPTAIGPFNYKVLKPTDKPPFFHWDLREFPNCEVPWSISQNVSDLDEDGDIDGDDKKLAFNEINASFQRWEDVDPSAIGFVAGPTNVTNQSIRLDGFNVIDWGNITPGFIALTGVFSNGTTGAIIESDILFNNSLNWTVGIENETNHTFDVQVTATHEIGHFIGIAHSPVVSSTMDNTTWPADLSKRTLENSDKNAANFLYTPDLGDAPDPYTAFNQYPSLVHNGAGRTLNGVRLVNPAQGAEHIFGHQPTGHAYEWLGELVEEATDSSECEAKVVDRDEHDDGVRFVNFTDVPGQKFNVIVNVSTSGLGASRYGANDKLYLNAWVDWNADGRWAPFEKIIEWEGGPGLNDTTNKGVLLNPATPWPTGTNSRELEFEVTVPPYTILEDRLREPFYSRFRLDYDENVGTAQNIDGTLNQDKGAAQFGEVEDYRHVREIDTPASTLIGLIVMAGLLSILIMRRIKG